jgi:hypothetical protein
MTCRFPIIIPYNEHIFLLVLHLVDNNNVPPSIKQKSYKAQPIFECRIRKFSEVYKHTQNWTVDGGSNFVKREYRYFTVHTYSKSTIHNKSFYLNLGTATQLKGSENSRHGSEVVLTLNEEMLGQG